MGYFRRGIDLLRPSALDSDSRYIEACRFAKDTLHGLAAAALLGAGVAEVMVDEPKAKILTVGGFLVGSVMSEAGALVNLGIIRNEQYHLSKSAEPAVEQA